MVLGDLLINKNGMNEMISHRHIIFETSFVNHGLDMRNLS